MELWKVHKFCETASLQQLQERRKMLEEAIRKGSVTHTNARTILEVVDSYIQMKSLFEGE